MLSVREFAAVCELTHKEMRLHLARLERDKLLKLGSVRGTPKDQAQGTGGAVIGTIITLCDLSFIGLSVLGSDQSQGTAQGQPKGTAQGTTGAQLGHTEQETGESENKNPTTDDESSTPRAIVVVDPLSALAERLHDHGRVAFGDATQLIQRWGGRSSWTSSARSSTRRCDRR